MFGGFFAPPENLPLSLKNILLTRNWFHTCCDQEAGGLLGFFFPSPFIVTTKKADLVTRFTQL